MDENRIDFEKDSPEVIRAKLKKYSEVNIKDVDPHTLVEIKDVKIDTSMPPRDRVKSFIEQVGNPYLIRRGDAVVKICFDGKGTMEEALKQAIKSSLSL